MALVTIPRIILGPFAGVIVDKSDRKRLIILGDTVRGISMLLLAFAAIGGFLKVWMLMGIILGISYLFSAFTEGFIQIPKIERKNINITFKEDFMDGLRFILRFKGLVRSLIMAFFINFLFSMIRIPWFLSDPSLGMTRYGLLSGFQSFGFLIGTIVLSFVNINPTHKYKIYLFSIFIFMSFIGLGAFVNNFIIIILCFTIAFAFIFVFNTMSNSTIMLVTPSDKRGKVFATIGTLAIAISPIGNFVGGVLGEFMNPRALIVGSTILGIIIIASIVLNQDVKKKLNYTPEETNNNC